ncbi:hypothetical protein AB0O01_10260 [Streptomyces sp. NPDC093252]|uniref:hypothetical protein n=1 Tax=Streptomyces sp. NPDC093252 TaxID=3154980 RepID=UPI003449F769
MTEHLTAGIRSGQYLPGTVLSPLRLSGRLGCSRARMDAAVADLATVGALQRQGARLFVPVTGNIPQIRARYIADRLTAQIAAGLHPPGSPLPAASTLALHFV